MKLISTALIKRGKIKKVSVLVDNKTAEMLECVEEEIKREYILSEYMFYKENKRIKYHCNSLETYEAEGYQFEDKTLRIAEEKETDRELYKKLYMALKSLTPIERWIVNEKYVKRRISFDIGCDMGISGSAVRHRLLRIIKKLKKFF